MRIKRKYHGWIYLESSTIIVKLETEKYTFEDNNAGAEKAASMLTRELGEEWRLEPYTPLGYRIFTEGEEDERN